MKRVLITGVAGFIGSNLADYLITKNQYEVIGIDNLSYGLKNQISSQVDFYEKDICDRDISKLFKGVDCVFHLAAKNCISDCQKNPTETIRTNIDGSINIFERCAEHNVDRLFYADSSAVYEGVKSFPSKEDIVKPKSFYAISKYSASLYLASIAKEKSLKYSILRYFNVYGPRQDYRRSVPPLMSAFIISLLKKNEPVIYGDGNKKRDFIHVDDINCFHEILINIEDGFNKKIFNLGSGYNYSVNEIYKIILNKLNMNVLPIFQANKLEEAEITLADISEARKLNWEPNVLLEEGIDDMINYIKNNVI
jgi:UDP-glucose 4-epimerase